jgi:hypothetical protein
MKNNNILRFKKILKKIERRTLFKRCIGNVKARQRLEYLRNKL